MMCDHDWVSRRENANGCTYICSKGCGGSLFIGWPTGRMSQEKAEELGLIEEAILGGEDYPYSSREGSGPSNLGL